MARRLRIEPYDPDAVDGDGDGIVQENTAWERPVGTRLLDEFGDEIRRGLMSTQRPARMRVVDRDGNDVAYQPSYSTARKKAPVPTQLGSIGAPSLAEMGVEPLATLADRGVRPIGETLQDIDAIVNAQTIEAPDAPEVPIPRPSMLTKLESSGPTDDLAPLSDPLTFGGYVASIAGGDPEIRESLRSSWDDSVSDYFTYQTNLNISFDEYIRLVEDASSGVELPTLIGQDGKPVDPRLLRYGLAEAMDMQIQRATNLRELMKDRVANGVADFMTRSPLSDKAREQLTQILATSFDSTNYIKPWSRLAKSGPIEHFGLPIRSFLTGEVNLSDDQVSDLVSWSIGGSRPLWLDSPDTPDEYKIILGPGLLPITKDDLLSSALPTLIPVAALPIYDFDTPELAEAKRSYARLRDQLRIDVANDPATTTWQLEKLMTEVNKLRDAHAQHEVSEAITSSMIQYMVARAPGEDASGDEIVRWQLVGTMLDSRDTSSNPYRFNTAEERLSILASSGVLNDDEMQHLITLVGWDFTKQPGWDDYSREVREATSHNQRAGVPGRHNSVGYRDNIFAMSPILIVDRSRMGDYRDVDGKPIPIAWNQGDAHPLILDIDLIISSLRERASISGREDEYDAVEKVRAIYAELRDKPQDDVFIEYEDSIVKRIFDLASAVDGPGISDSIVKANARLMMPPGPIIDSSSRPELIRLLTERPAHHAARSIASSYVGQWALTSNGNHPTSLALQEIAQELFRLDNDLVVDLYGIYSPRPGDLTHAEMENAIKRVRERRGELMKLFLESQYANTQDFFRRRGQTHVTVARGMGLPNDHPYVEELIGLETPTGGIELESGWSEVMFSGPRHLDVVMPMRPMSSFGTYLPGMAMFVKREDRGGVTVISRVPIHQIIGTPFSGVGCLSEYEMVVLGRPLVGRVYRSIRLAEQGVFMRTWF